MQAREKKERAFVPAGQSTQMIVGATPESDFQILNLSAALYRTLSLKRVFFSAYTPVNDDARLPCTDALQLNREHRLYQADWLLRFYRFDVTEIIDEEHPFLDPEVDPKANWAAQQPGLLPRGGEQGAARGALARARHRREGGARHHARPAFHHARARRELRKLGMAYKRARFFVTCNGSVRRGQGTDFSREAPARAPGRHAEGRQPRPPRRQGHPRRS